MSLSIQGTERDGYDETIMPVDYKKNGQIIDNIIFRELVAPLKSNVRLTCLIDCCHSGTGKNKIKDFLNQRLLRNQLMLLSQ